MNDKEQLMNCKISIPLILSAILLPGASWAQCNANIHGVAQLDSPPSAGECRAPVQINAAAGANVQSGQSLQLLAPNINFQPGFHVAKGGQLQAGKNYSDAARLLTQATFGPTQESLDHLMELGSAEAWLDEQLAIPLHRQLPRMRTLANRMCSFPDPDAPPDSENTDTYNGYARRQAWWEQVIDGDDQLRQRVAFSLSQILVVSDVGQLGDYQFGMTDYWDTLLEHAFGNYRDLLEAVTLHPMMGEWLSSIRNRKAVPAENIHPDENYAREILQLFSIGLHQLNMDGTLKKDANGLPIPTYGQAEVKEFARVFTGLVYYYDNPNYRDDWEWRSPWSGAITTHPMVPLEEIHDKGEKTLLNGQIIPAGGNTLSDISAAIDIIFNHPNVPPFVSKQLIQRMVTSNPSPAYIARVARVFADNGSGERGDLKAVVKAILLDPEARDSHSSTEHFGKLREPLLRFSHLWRAFGLPKKTRNGSLWEQKSCGRSNYKIYWVWWLDSFLRDTGQDILGAPSVFNFYQPGFSPSGPVASTGLVAPEFQIASESWLTGIASSMNWQIQASLWVDDIDKYEWSILDLRNEAPWGASPEYLLKRFNLLLLNGQMSAAEYKVLEAHLNSVKNDTNSEDADVVRDAILLLVNSPNYLIQK
jgi:uncharacterized protein (DUF1800 family)